MGFACHSVQGEYAAGLKKKLKVTLSRSRTTIYGPLDTWVTLTGYESKRFFGRVLKMAQRCNVGVSVASVVVAKQFIYGYERAK